MYDLLTSDRANTTCKVAAFSGPRWAQPDHFWEENMTLSDKEVKLIEAYERHGRADLAHCVKNARIHQLLFCFFDDDKFLYTTYKSKKFMSCRHAMKSVFEPDSTPEAITIQQWDMEMERKYEGDEGLAIVRELDQRQLETRSRSDIVYPLQRVMRRSWKCCRKITGRT